MKLLGSILIIASFGFFGVFKAYALNKRCKNLAEIKGIIEALKTEIGFLKKELSSALISSSKNSSAFILFSDFSKALKDSDTDKAWYESLEKNADTLYLTEKDTDVLKKLSKGLGKTDADNQIKHLNFILALISELYNDATEEYKLKGSIYKSSGISLGILMVLLLI